MSIKFEGETLEALRQLTARVLTLEKLVLELKKQPVDEVSDWLRKRKNGSNRTPINS